MTAEEFSDRIKKRCPGAVIEGPPEGGRTWWWLDIRLGNRLVVIEYHEGRGFGVSSLPSEGFGDGPDAVWPTPEEALECVVQLLTSSW